MPRAVILLAPVAPLRGGIAHHSTALAKALASVADVRLEVRSFRRLYPPFLYPGASDRDPALDRVLPFAVHYSLDTLNPRSWGVAAQAGDVAIIPAWTFFVAPMLGAIARSLRRRGVSVVMIVHNVIDHEGAGWKSRLSNWQLAAASGFIVHTDDLARQLRQTGFTQPISVVPHPSYDDFPEPLRTLPREFGLELLCFGLVRHYKGVDIALRALAASGLGDVRLTVAGEVWDGRDTLQTLLRLPELRGKVELIDHYVTDADTAELFERCDVVVAPYRSITGSGVLALARRYRRPVIATNLPGFADLIENGRTGWLVPAGDEAALAEILRRHATRDAATAMQSNIAEATGAGWTGFANAILDVADRITMPAGMPS